MKLPRILRPFAAGALLLASQALENIARRIAPPYVSDRSDTPPAPRSAPPAPAPFRVALTPEAQAMLARQGGKAEPVEPEPLAGSLEARRRAGAL